MAQKIIDLPGIGPVTLVKRRGSKNLRLSILPSGRIRITLPAWAPYAAAINFGRSRTAWIVQHTADLAPTTLRQGHRIGKSYRLSFVTKPTAKNTQARLGINSITVTTLLPYDHYDVQAKASAAAERALKKEAQQLLPVRVEQSAAKYGFAYKDIKIKRLTGRWGSCSSQGTITLNYFLMQLPWRLIDYVIIHELVHTKHMNHSRSFWALAEKVQPDAKLRRREIKKCRPILLPQ